MNTDRLRELDKTRCPTCGDPVVWMAFHHGQSGDHDHRVPLALLDELDALRAVAEAARYQHETGDLHDGEHGEPHQWCCGVGAALDRLDQQGGEK